MRRRRAFDSETGVAPRAVTNTHVEGLEIEVDHVTARGKAKVDVGVLFEETSEPRHEPSGRERGDDADGDERALAMQRRAQLGVGFAQPMKNAMELGGPGLPLRRQEKAPRGAAKERDTELTFQRFDLMANGGLRDAELGRGAGEAQMARGGLEREQRVERRQR